MKVKSNQYWSTLIVGMVGTILLGYVTLLMLFNLIPPETTSLDPKSLLYFLCCLIFGAGWFVGIGLRWAKITWGSSK